MNATAVGVLLFLFWDVLSVAWAPIDDALTSAHEGKGGLGAAAGYGLLFGGGLAVGLLALVYYESWMARQLLHVGAPGASPGGHGPGAMGVSEVKARRHNRLANWSAARRLSLLIAMGIGLHNFAEGLAIGQSAASGKLALALPLVIGFGLHNATESFGIVPPHQRYRRRGQPACAELGLPAGDGRHRGRPHLPSDPGGPPVHERGRQRRVPDLGRRIDPLCGTRLIAVANKARRADLLAYGLLLGLLAGFLTDAIVTAAGA